MNDSGDYLFIIRRDVVCVKCGSKGAIKSYGKFYANGLKDKVDELGKISKPLMEKYRNSPYMSHSMGFGGTIPHECINCGNTGLIDMDGLEGYRKAFDSIKEVTTDGSK